MCVSEPAWLDVADLDSQDEIRVLDFGDLSEDRTHAAPEERADGSLKQELEQLRRVDVRV